MHGALFTLSSSSDVVVQYRMVIAFKRVFCLCREEGRERERERERE